MNRYISSACRWMAMATWFAFLAGGTEYPFMTPMLLAMCAVSYLVVACNLEGLRHEGSNHG